MEDRKMQEGDSPFPVLHFQSTP